ncbi:MAG: DUF929 family protein [Dactylosporangium sp.]|nr:DUF929 domain-containing protein [Dactylosporangium sp.]NNJ62454.1 DUF929 family protein [Dactylosporangium sp.]
MSEPERPATQPDRTRRLRMAAAGAAIAAVVVVLMAMIIVKLADGGAEPAGQAGTPPTAAGTGPQSPDTAKVVAAVTGVPAAVLDQVGRGTVAALPSPLDNQPALRDGDKPLALFIGSEACPHCGTQRWAVAVAFARFGTFQDLTTSPRGSQTPKALSFYGATYTSQYLSLQTVEAASSSGERLQELTAEQQAVMSSYGTGAVPFLDLGNRYVMIGSSYSSDAMTGKTALQIAEALDDPDDPITKAIGGGANALTTAICTMTGNQPGEVCSGAAAMAYAGAF